MDVGKILRATAARLPDKKAVIFGNKSITFKKLDQAADSVATFLTNRGVKKGDRVGIIFPNTPEFVLVYFGILRLGAIGVPLDNRLKGEEISSVLRDAGVKTVFLTKNKWNEVQVELEQAGCLHTVVISGEENSGNFSLEPILKRQMPGKSIEAETDEEDEALYLYTSGTTGKHKGVVLSFRNLDCFPLTMNRMLKAGENDVIGLILPVSHISGPIVSNLIAFNGSTMVMFEHLRPDRILEEVDQQGITFFFGVPPIFQSLLRVPRRDRYQLKSLVYVAMMGTSVPVQLMKKFREAFPTVKAIQGYGLTETSPFITLLPLEYADSKIGSIGLPVPDIQIKLLGTNGERVAPGEAGEIVVNGPMVMKGYHNNPEATKEVLREGWLYTGDLGRIDKDGFIYHLGRKDDMVITGGLNVFPAEVENVLMKHPDVLEAGVAGVPDENRGQVIKAVVVPKPGKSLDKKDISAFCRKHLANFKIPKLIEFREVLPKTSTGKLSRRDLM